MNPQDIYLKHCQQFADINFDQKSLKIKDYHINQKDLDDKIFVKAVAIGEKNDDDCSSSNIVSRGKKDDMKNNLLGMLAAELTLQVKDAKL